MRLLIHFFFFSFTFIQGRVNILKPERIINFSKKKDRKKENHFQLLLKTQNKGL